MNMLQSFGGGGGGSDSGDAELKQRLIANVKKEAKQLMEESVCKKYVHEESSSVTSLCAAIEACLSNGLRRRALGLFKTSSTTALIQKIAKTCPEADYISRRLHEVELANESQIIAANKRSSSSSDSIIKPKLLSKGSSSSITTINTAVSGASSSVAAAPIVRYLWIRLALYEKRLLKIIEYLVTNANNYYDRDALVADAESGSILNTLLEGPCALEYTRAKTVDHYWTDPHADELVQRHRISSGNRTPPTSHRPVINFKRSLHTSSEDTSSGSFKVSSPLSVAKDYVESLHQNSRSQLIYGKNNVLVLPKDISEPLPGYLSLHQNVQSLTVKWTPNQVMNGCKDGDDKSFYWSYAININFDEIVYVHCHQNGGEDTGGTIILVGQDGLQRPPIHFPGGDHMQTFLGCLENGLLPHGALDPPLWSQRGIGKKFPWPKSVKRRGLPSVMESTDETPIDYVFRVVSKSHHEEFLATHPVLELGRSSPRRKHLGSCSTTGSSDCSSKSISIDQIAADPPQDPANQTASIELVCSTMRRQIISRAFYGWLAYCRHLSTVRTHLSGLVNGRITPDLEAREEGLTEKKWEDMHVNGVISSESEVFRLVYFGGVEPNLRKEVWPYLLGHYSFGSTPEERVKQDEDSKHYYETTMSEWLACEAILRQHEKDVAAKELAKKLAAEKAKATTADGVAKHVSRQEEIDGDDVDNEVFDDHGFSDMSDPGDDNDNKLQTENVGQFKVEESNIKNRSTIDDLGNGGEETAEYVIEDVAEDGEEMEDAQKATTDDEDVLELRKDPVVLEFENMNGMESLSLQENCFADSEAEAGLTPDNNSGGVLLMSIKSSPSTSSYETVGNEFADMGEISEASQPLTKFHSVDDVRSAAEEVVGVDDKELMPRHAVIITEAVSLDMLQCCCDEETNEAISRKTSLMSPMNDDITIVASMDALQEPKSACVSPASSNGGVYTIEELEDLGTNLERLDKDVVRCDRNYWYFANENLEKLRNIIATWVWQHKEVGYLQGMCDLLAPLLVIFDDEAMSYNCFSKLMERMVENFPNGGAMDMHFANMRSLIQILDPIMYEVMDSSSDYSHFYFCYRWFLLDFKRELLYDDIFATWEIIWAAKHVASSHFVLFLALALLETYRDIILANAMDFTDVIKFFNEMAERHDVQSVLQLSRSLVLQLQTIIENK